MANIAPLRIGDNLRNLLPGYFPLPLEIQIGDSGTVIIALCIRAITGIEGYGASA